jgi:hypothetical protein
MRGAGVQINESLAAHYFKLSADQGNPHGQLNYGSCLMRGHGIQMNKSLAAHYFKLSADQGNPLGQLNYGVCLMRGYGVQMNKSLAVRYFKLSADQGEPEGQVRYGFCLQHGCGIRMNKSLAAHYFKLSGDPTAYSDYLRVFGSDADVACDDHDAGVLLAGEDTNIERRLNDEGSRGFAYYLNMDGQSPDL